MPRKTLKQRKGRNPTDVNQNRVRSIIDSVIGIENPDVLMNEIRNVLQQSGKVPQVGKYYTFVYSPKTPNIQYDKNPLVAVTEVYNWGFKGINFHWGEMRQYTWNEIVGSLYEVYPEELADLREVPFSNIRLNS